MLDMEDTLENTLKKDLFVDTNIAKNFTNPLDKEYKKLIRWLLEHGCWVVSKKLLVEFGRTNRNIAVITDQLNREGRLKIITNEEHNKFVFSKLAEKRLTCNIEDRWHLKTILLSHRKIAIIIDQALRNDVNNHPKKEGIKPLAVSRPEEIDYENYTV
jgi:hypothetical protein